MDVLMTLVMELVGLECQTDAFSNSNEPQSRKTQILPIFSVKTLLMEAIGLEGQQVHFQVQTIPKARKN
ncbi:hypothetical protein H5410_005431 [Solanum commersonii]|uniref:Uncharacterized protein n=1 Tax=Solanum commersonii TaxID=4109 RepID=A0A9J6A6L5_SOLCO|nr:hypothetical protein H5410_005431 [Solanum commersonii]